MLSAPSGEVLPMDVRAAGDVELPYQSNFTEDDFEAAVERCVEYIRAGDIFPVVFSQRLKTQLRSHPFQRDSRRNHHACWMQLLYAPAPSHPSHR